MRSLRDIKIPDFKFPKISFKNFEELINLREQIFYSNMEYDPAKIILPENVQKR